MSHVRRLLVPSVVALGLAAFTLTVPNPAELSAAPLTEVWSTPGTFTWTVPSNVTGVTVDAGAPQASRRTTPVASVDRSSPRSR